MSEHDREKKPENEAVPSAGTQPTIPIRLEPKAGRFDLRRTSTPDPAPTSQPWLGNEKTMIDLPPKNSAVAADPQAEPWIGNDQTVVGSVPGREASWLGNEQTMVGTGDAAAPSQGTAAEWLGREATLVSTPGGSSGSTSSSGRQPPMLRKTTATMDDGWHLKGRKGPLTGLVLGDFEIGGILGEGGMGIVYRAKQVSLKRRVALKVLPPAMANDQRVRERFEMEARTASLIDSPHVVRVFGAGEVEGTIYFAMEYVEGTDLAIIIREKQDAKESMASDEAAGYVLQAARGLAEAGKHNIVHRDIKPPNLMVTAKGLVKIADFGISKVAGEHSLTMTGTAVGTPAYVSPEQGRGDAVDQRSDIYSLGVVFYELLTGQKPFDGTTANALIYQHNYTEPKLPSDLRVGVPEAYQAIALKCLQKDPAKRYQDAAEMVADLERVRAGSAPMTALMNVFGTGADEAMRRLGIGKRRWWPLIGAAAVLLIATGLGLWWWQGQTDRRASIALYRGNLKSLDQPLAVNPKAPDDLARLAKLVGDVDADVARWRGKLGKVQTLRARLARLDQADLPDAVLHRDAALDIERYRQEVGGKGGDVLRWQARLDDAKREIERLRAALAEVDQTAVVSDDLRARAAPHLSELCRLAGDDDADAKRWRERLVDAKTREDELRQRLAVLDGADAAIPEARLQALEADLAGLIAMVGADDAPAQGWSARLQVHQQNLARLRKNLVRLDPVTWATVGLQVELGGDLGSFRKLADANDPDLKRWLQKMDDSASRIAALRQQLARLDREQALTMGEQQAMTEHLADFRGLVSPDDGQLQAWTARMRDEAAAYDAARRALARLDQPARMHVAELDACGKAFAHLEHIGGLPEHAPAWRQRLGEENAAVAELRRLLAPPAGGATTIDETLVDRVDRLAAIAGEADEDVKRWRGVVDEYHRLHDALAKLDKVASPPEKADDLIAGYTRIAGENDAAARRWKAKLSALAKLNALLAPLDRQAPVPDGAETALRELADRIGENDPQVKRWSTKVARVGVLKTQLGRDLPHAYLLPADASAQLDELRKLVGDADIQARPWIARLTILIGPGKPVWARDYGRDESGPWADLVLAGSTQRFRWCPSGSFTIGSPDSEAGRDSDETRVPMRLSRSFWLADSECTQALWQAVTNDNPSRFRGPDRPVERCSWDDCKAFVLRLSQRVPGLDARLPTECEWEYASRAGCDAPFVGYLGAVKPAKLESFAWFVANSGGSPQDVKRRFPNALGLHDLHGNVWEWCEDRYGVYPPTGAVDHVGREADTRVARGGSWGDKPDKCRVANRLAVRPDMRTVYLGMRLAVTAVWADGAEPGSEIGRATATKE